MEEDFINRDVELVLIGGSAGSLEVIITMLSALRVSDQLPIVIVLHRRPGENTGLIELLAFKTKLRVKEAEEKEPVINNTIYIAPQDYHLLIEKDHTLSLDYSEKENYSRPSIDITFQAASEAYGNKLVCILLSGANADGTQGLISVKNNGGIVVVQDPSSALVPYMPEHALTKIKADRILHANDIGGFINYLNREI